MANESWATFLRHARIDPPRAVRPCSLDKKGSMKNRRNSAWLYFVAIALFSPCMAAAPISSCTSNLRSCNAYEGQILTFPGLRISGDVVVRDGSGIPANLFRIFNNFVIRVEE